MNLRNARGTGAVIPGTGSSATALHPLNRLACQGQVLAGIEVGLHASWALITFRMSELRMPDTSLVQIHHYWSARVGSVSQSVRHGQGPPTLTQVRDWRLGAQVGGLAQIPGHLNLGGFGPLDG